MQLPNPIRRTLLALARWRMRRRPSRIIGHNYMRRWYIIPRNPLANIYLHEFKGSDDDRALHTHPWWSCSIILAGWYLEHIPQFPLSPAGPTQAIFRDTGAITSRPPEGAHRIEILATPAITLFITGPRIREWGFWCPKIGFRHWRVFTDPTDPGQTGRGCD